jgi:hypothetical protein
MTALFYRDGREFIGNPAMMGAGRPYTMGQLKCGRCGGAGGSDKWRHTGWTCFDCNGSGDGRVIRMPLYTAERLASLNAIQARRRAAKAAEQAARLAAAQAEAEAARGAFQAQHGEAIRWLESVALSETEDNGIRPGFCGDMLIRARQWASWTDAQATAVYASWERAKARELVKASSSWVGEVGKRMTVTVTVERQNVFYRRDFTGYGEEAVYVTTMRTADGNAIVVKSPRFSAEVGETLVLTATVKEHSEYRGERQTLVQRPTVKVAA